MLVRLLTYFILICCTCAFLLLTKFTLLSYDPMIINDFEIDVDHIRNLVKDDQLPLHINTLIIAEGFFPEWFMITDGSIKNHPNVFFSTQLIYEDKTIIIDPVHPEYMQEDFPYATIHYEENYQIMQQALKQADIILATHEHWDHIGGFFDSPHRDELIDKIILTEEQVTGHTEKMDFDFTTLPNIISYDKYYKAAPGIVFIKSPGHTPGEQMIYIKTKEHEFLFIGDVVLNSINLRENRTLPVATATTGHMDREAIMKQIIAINNVDPEIHIVISHDMSLYEIHIQNGILRSGFAI